MTQKNQYWQMVRGICILAVIMIHCPTGQDYTNYDYHAWIILRQFVNFPVAIFVFLAGYFMPQEKIQGDYKGFFVRRGGVRLLIPYLVWSCVYLIRSTVFGGTTLRHIIYALVCGKAATPFYYIVVMLQLTVITPWLIKHRRNWMYLVTPAYLVVIYTYNIVSGSMLRLYETFFPAWFFFYILGMDCRSGKCDRLIDKVNGSWVVAALSLSIGEAYGLRVVGCADGFVYSQIKFSSFLYAAVIALWLQKKETTDVKSNALSIIGDYSYGIFYCHILVLWIIRKVVQMMNLNSFWIINFGLCLTMTAVVSIMIVWTVRTIMKKIKCERILPMIGF